MNKFIQLLSTTLFVAVALLALPLRADNVASLGINPTTGAVALTSRWSIGGGLAGFHLMAQDLSLGGGANQFYSIKGSTIPAGGDISAFVHYLAASGAATPSADIGSKLTPDSYSDLTSADPDVGFGPVNFYLVHHKSSGDYFSVIKPSSGTASSVTDLKPMSGPGGPGTLGASGYFGLTFAAADLGSGPNLFYYLRTKTNGNTEFGNLDPALLNTSTDKFDVGQMGFNFITFAGNDVGFGANKMYYLRVDPVTTFTILGTLDPVTGKTADIANLGSVYSTLDYVPGDVGFGAGQFYATGAINASGQTVSFAAQQDRLISGGSFTVAPSATSALPIALTVVPGSVGAAAISGPVAGVFTITPTAPGLITLQATQAGQVAPIPYEFNMLRQSFTISGAALLAITSQPTAQTAVLGATAVLSVAASGTTTVSYQWRKAGVNISGGSNASALTATLSLPSVQASDATSYDVVVTDAAGSIVSNPVLLTVSTAAPVISNSPLTAAGTIGSSFSFTIAASGSPTSFTASPLPAGLTLATGTGAITGAPTAVGTTSVLLGATNSSGTGNATLTITVAAAGVAPIVTNSPLTAGGTVGTAFTYTITASGTPTSYTATPLPAGLTIASGTGIISGIPTAVGTTSVLLGATNGTGTGNATLSITVAAAGVAPVINNSPLTAAGTIGTPFSFSITASGSPTNFTATPLPAGLSIVALTGVITGSPTATGTTAVILSATNGIGTGHATLTITVAAAGIAPIITNSPLTSAGTVGTPFTFSITASGSPGSYSGTPLPAGLTLVTATGVITGTPSAAGTTSVLLGATNGTGTGNATLVITVAPAGVAPIITNAPLAAAATVGTGFSYSITASGSPSSYTATPLPPGLTLVSATGVITGVPTTPGITTVLLGATNLTGTGSVTLTITVAAAGTAPVISNPVPVAAGTIGTPFTYAIIASGTPTVYSAAPLPAGLTLVSATGVITGTPTAAGSTVVTISATNSLGTTTSLLTITVGAAGVAPIITSPGVASGTAGAPFPTYLIVTTGLPTSYSATGLPAGLSINPLTGAITGTALSAGTYPVTITATNANGSTSANLVITVAAAPASRIVNFSLRALSGPGAQSLVMGFIVTGDGKNVIVRGIGPTLASFGVSNVLADPLLTLYSSSNVIGSDDNWETNSAGLSQSALVSSLDLQVGAFTVPTGSKDAVLVAMLNHGPYTASVLGQNSSTGVALAEVYDTDSNFSARLTNVSARMTVGTGDGALLAGFVIAGNTPKTVLIRGIGPTLATFGVPGPMADPQLTLFAGTSVLASNDNWETGTSTAAQISMAAASVGAFALPPGSKDASILITLQPGIYTVQLSGVSTPTGIAMIEIYDVL